MTNEGPGSFEGGGLADTNKGKGRQYQPSIKPYYTSANAALYLGEGVKMTFSSFSTWADLSASHGWMIFLRWCNNNNSELYLYDHTNTAFKNRR